MKAITLTSAIICTLFLATSAPVTGQPRQGRGMRRNDGKEMPQACRMMMQKRQEMMQEMEQMETDLSEKMEKMQSAQGDAKINAMAEVITSLVEQRKMMRSKMQEMSQEKMMHMQGHKGDGCPMMQGKKDSSNQPEND